MNDEGNGKLVAVGTFVAALGFMLFWVEGLRFWSADYTDWLDQVYNMSALHKIAAMFVPSFYDWDILNRPVEACVTAGLHRLYGYHAAPYFVFKAGVFAVTMALLAWTIWASTRDVQPAAAVAIALISSSPMYSALLLYGDFSILSQFFLVFAIAMILWERRVHDSMLWHKRLVVLGAAGLAVFLAAQTKLSALVFLPTLLCFAVVNGWKGIARYGPLLIVLSLFTLPWKAIMTWSLPPFLTPSGPSATEGGWNGISLGAFSAMTVGSGPAVDRLYEAFGKPPTSVLSLYLVWLVLGLGILWASILGSRHPMRALKRQWNLESTPGERSLLWLLGLWAFWVIVGMASAPRLNPFDRTRYLAELALPLHALILIIFWRLIAFIDSPGTRTVTLITLAMLQALPNLYFMRQTRGSVATERIAIDKTLEYVHGRIEDATVFFVEFPSPPRQYSPEGRNVIYEATPEEIKNPESLPGGRDAYVVTATASTDPRLIQAAWFDGDTNSYYDRVFGTFKNGGSEPGYFVYQVEPNLRLNRGLMSSGTETVE